MEENETSSHSRSWDARRNYEKLHDLARSGVNLATLRGRSPHPPASVADDVEALVDNLFCGGGADPRLRVQSLSGAVFEGRRSQLRGRLRTMSHIVPNPLFAERRFLVIGFDWCEEIAGCPGPDAGILGLLRELRLTIPDLCSAALLELATVAPLALVTGDGGQALQGWFGTHNVEEAELRRFMQSAIQRGAGLPFDGWCWPWQRPFQKEYWFSAFAEGISLLGYQPSFWNPMKPVLMPAGINAAGSNPVHFFNREVAAQ